MRKKRILAQLSRLLPFIALGLAALPAAGPYFGAGLPRTNDAAHHLYRTLALDRLVREGLLWPRWSPDLVHGYGYPVYSFFPSLSHFLVEIYHLAGLPLTPSYGAAVLCCFVLAAWTAYLLARDLFGPVGGWGAAVAYVYSPYLLYDAHVRGSLPESLALALLPLLPLVLRRASIHGGCWVAACGLVSGLILLGHPGITLQLVIPLGLLLMWLGWREGWRDLWKPVAGLALGALVTAFFWLPMFADLRYVQSDIAVARGYDYRDYFLTLGDLLAWPRMPADPALLNPPVVRSLPQVGLALAAVGIPYRWRHLGHAARSRIGLWLGLLIVCTVLVTPLSLPLWELLPLLKLTLTPFRLLGLASLSGALLVAASLTDLRMSARTLAVLAAVTMLLLIGSIPWLYPPREPVPESPTIADLVAFEQPPVFIGTTVLGEYLPRWVKELPDMRAMRDRLAAGESPDRLVVPEGVSARLQTGSVLDATYLINSDDASTLTYRQFYFPGWRVTLDGGPIVPRPSQPHGLLLIDIPAGEHVLNVTFGTTPARTLGWVLSSLGVLTTAAVVARALFREVRRASSVAAPALPARWLLPLVVLLLAGKVFFDRIDTPLHRSALGPEGLDGIQHPLGADFAGELELLGYEQSADHVAAEDTVTLTLYWRSMRAIGVVYETVMQVVDEAGLVWSTGDTPRPSNWRWAPGTDSWSLDSYVMDSRLLRLVDGTPPGEYGFLVTLVRRDTHQTVAEQGIGQLVVARPARGDRPLEEGMEPAMEAQEWDGLQLLGSRTDRREAGPGDQVRVTLLWQATESSTASSGRLELRLMTGEGQSVLETTAPVARHYPPARWQPGDRLRTEVLLRLPAHAPVGEHSWQVQLEGVDYVAPQSIGTLSVHIPERSWTIPTLDVATNILLGDVATLLGANIQPIDVPLRPPATVTATLVWRAEAETGTSYRVFLHLVGPGGDLVTQSDGEPAHWTRPTTGWLPGEVVTDERILEIPASGVAGEYTLVCGLYDAVTAERLTASDGSDAIELATIVVEGP